MPSQDDVRRIASRLPGAIEGEGRFGFSVPVKGKAKGFLWEWAERAHPKKPKVLNPGVLAVVVPHLGVKEMWLNSGVPGLFTEPHYDGYAAVLVRLEEVPPDVLEDLVIEAWRCKAPKEAVKAFDEASEPRA
ncbi:MAG: hypothetical protein KIS66_11235 [Fimbriimonadaceae bacterium]|nr:hypothetical protein [Fimbriimonadaceae bacterium]